MFGKIKKIHFVGIGGIGMSGMADLLINLGFEVSGSDINTTDITKGLESKGARIFKGHSKDNIEDCDVVVYSSAVMLDNPELVTAKETRIPIIRRAEMLGELLKLKNKSIAIAGTHGKTTTTSMMGCVLTEAELDPTLIVGGIVKSLDVNAVLGTGEFIIAEADEFDKSFLQLQPTYSIITNIDLDHLECYKNEDDLFNSFTSFANAIPFYGVVAVCTDEPFVQKILPNISRPVISYGITNPADFSADNIQFNGSTTEFEVYHKDKSLGDIQLQVPGNHNVKNALGVIALCHELEVGFESIQKGLLNFTGVRRRFEIKGTFNDIFVIDDYAHHPTEISATLQAIKNGWKNPLVSVLQPHLYSRTRDFFEEFARALLISETIVVTDVYPAREKPIEGITGKLIADAAKKLGHHKVYWIEDKNQIYNLLKEIVFPGDIIITMGAGDIWEICDQYVEYLQQHHTAVKN